MLSFQADATEYNNGFVGKYKRSRNKAYFKQYGRRFEPHRSGFTIQKKCFLSLV